MGLLFPEVSYDSVGESQPVSTSDLTELGNAARFARDFGRYVRYSPGLEWHVYVGSEHRWVPDQQGLRVAERMGHQAVRLSRSEEESEQKWGIRSQSNAGIKGAMNLLRSVPGIAVEPAHFDADPFLLNLRGGKVLRMNPDAWQSDGEIPFTRTEDATPEHLCTRQTRATPKFHEHSLFEALVEFMFPDPGTRDFVKRALGYSITGDVSREALFILYGGAGMGKNTLLEPILHALGTYATTAAPDLLTRKRAGSEAIPTDVADLMGRRLVWANEASDENSLDEEKVKRIVSTGTVKARRMRQDFFEFPMTHKLWLTTNHLPRIQDQDNGIWRRVFPVELTRTLSSGQWSGGDLKAQLFEQSEQETILAWLIEGATDYLQRGLDAPESITKWREDYKAEGDIVGLFLSEACYVTEDEGPPTERLSNPQLWAKWRAWAEGDRERESYSHSRLTRKLKSRGILPHRGRNGGPTFWPNLANK